MNELSVIGSLRLRKDYWDHHVVNIASCEKGLFGERLFRRPEKKVERNHKRIEITLIRAKCKFL